MILIEQACMQFSLHIIRKENCHKYENLDINGHFELFDLLFSTLETENQLISEMLYG